ETTDNLNNQPYGIVNTYPNPNLRWEKVGVLNAGIDFGSRNNVLTGSVEFYSKKSTDLIARQPIDPTVGIPSGLVFRNVADMLTRGVDIQLNTRNLTGPFKWQTGILFNYNRDEVTAYNTNGASGGNYVFGGYGISPVQGKPIYSISSFKWAGLDPANGNPVGIVNGQRSEDYSAIVYKTPISGLDYNGPALPPFFGAVSNTFDYKGFTLYINISYRLGYYFKKSTINYYNLYNNWAGNSDFAQRWQKPGDEAHTHVPSMPALADDSYERDFFYQYSSANVQKADNIRLQDLNISYRIPLAKNNTLHLKDLQVYIYGRNLGILWRANKLGIDPDYPDTALPPSYSISFGLKTRF
ncbi:MAG: SusC/RagA family TonB-linked outer membrane protein, partial [Mucilaginibacter sp.]|nr:SusC/RagA family TonB-linked outer membrane protein [Mucilaginibacter sp.]